MDRAANVFLLKERDKKTTGPEGSAAHWSLLVETLGNSGRPGSVYQYDAIYNSARIVLARERRLSRKSIGDRSWPGSEKMEADSFFLSAADTLVKETNSSKRTYNPLTDNCQECVLNLLKVATTKGQDVTVHTSRTIGFRAMRWILFILMSYIIIKMVWFAIGQLYGPEYSKELYKNCIMSMASSMRLIHFLVVPIIRYLLTVALSLYSYAGTLRHLAKSKRVVNPYFRDALAFLVSLVPMIMVTEIFGLLGDWFTVLIMLYCFIMQVFKMEPYSAPILSPIIHLEVVGSKLKKYIAEIGVIISFFQRKLIGKSRLSQSIDSIV